MLVLIVGVTTEAQLILVPSLYKYFEAESAGSKSYVFAELV